MIQAFHVYKQYDRESSALSDITLHIRKGEFCFLTGPSGAGKTTFLKLVFREEVPTQGQILVAGRNITAIPAGQMSAEQLVLAAEAVLAGQAGGAAPARRARLQHHALAHGRTLDAGPERGDFARDVIAQDVGEREAAPGQALARPDVQVVERACAHAHQHLARTGLRVGKGGRLEHLGAAVAVDHDRFHGGILSRRSL